MDADKVVVRLGVGCQLFLQVLNDGFQNKGFGGGNAIGGSGSIATHGLSSSGPRDIVGQQSQQDGRDGSLGDNQKVVEGQPQVFLQFVIGQVLRVG